MGQKCQGALGSPRRPRVKATPAEEGLRPSPLPPPPYALRSMGVAGVCPRTGANRRVPARAGASLALAGLDRVRLRAARDLSCWTCSYRGSPVHQPIRPAPAGVSPARPKSRSTSQTRAVFLTVYCKCTGGHNYTNSRSGNPSPACCFARFAPPRLGRQVGQPAWGPLAPPCRVACRRGVAARAKRLPRGRARRRTSPRQ